MFIRMPVIVAVAIVGPLGFLCIGAFLGGAIVHRLSRNSSTPAPVQGQPQTALPQSKPNEAAEVRTPTIPNEAEEDRTPICQCSADELVRAWHENFAAFAKQYDGKWVMVHGKAERVTEGFNRSKGGSGHKEPQMEFAWSGDDRLHCFFENPDELLSLKRGEPVVVIGKVYCGRIGSIHLVRCRMDKANGNSRQR